MKLLVAIKHVVDFNIKVRVKENGTGVNLSNVRMSINPFDEIAVEEALRVKDEGKASEVIVVSVGLQMARETLRTGLAMGADRAILVKTNRAVEPLVVAKALKVVVIEEKPDMVFLGKQAIDDDSNQTGQMLAALLGWGQGTFASKLKIAEKTAEITREVDRGLQTLSVKLPAVMTVDLRLNEPRYVSLPNLIKAKKKMIEEKSLLDLGINAVAHLKVLNVEEPATRKAGMKVASVNELVGKLKAVGVI